ncbi:TPA_asm: maturation protein [ssRNA phage Gephyllon.4_4]|uniref:Maturation protein n=2 Tax=unclassified Fiersviridae TaxID=2852980 RepID=A0A8S5KXB0_9VIRU|nr:maturation protein [ssRNA phage Gephyllon.4_4]QDH87347.1 MAG: hypothetical protein H4BulkLitter22333_000002 [Leviviridae sp.]DAD50150.1 TPA_asm: maturation protein [ssRNA phage Gephyllon.4_4]
MVLPVTGPFLQPIADSRTAYRDKRVYRQAKPVTLPLQYFIDVAYNRSSVNNNLGGGSQFFGATSLVPNAEGGYSDVINKAYGKLVEAVSNSAQLGATFAEGHQSMSMMLARLGQLTDFTKRIRRLDFIGAARVVNLAVVPKGVSAKRSLANNWLEYSFGWKPLIEDIYNALDHLQNPIKSTRPKGSGRSTHSVTVTSGSIASGFWSIQSAFGVRYAKCGCEVTINNYNLFLLNKLGLANPVAVAWELIPFSFVVDWFVTVGEFLNSGTDFLGLTVTNPWTLWGFHGLCQDYRGNPFWIPTSGIHNWNVAHMERKPSISGPTLMVRPARIWGWQRVANATSVLIQVMSKR